MKYYINEIHSPFVPYNQLIIGLFKSTDDGLSYITNEGVVDYVKDCIVLAYYIQNRHAGYEPKGYPHIREYVIYQYFDRLSIGSPMWTESLEAADDSIAIDKFFQEQFDTRFQPIAIKALEPQSSEDCISRESVIEWLKDKDIIKTKNQEENARRELAELPSVTPERPKGTWIVHPKGIYAHLVCSKCLSNAPYDCETNYCPNCGAKMEVEE